MRPMQYTRFGFDQSVVVIKSLTSDINYLLTYIARTSPVLVICNFTLAVMQRSRPDECGQIGRYLIVIKHKEANTKSTVILMWCICIYIYIYIGIHLFVKLLPTIYIVWLHLDTRSRFTLIIELPILKLLTRLGDCRSYCVLIRT